MNKEQQNVSEVDLVAVTGCNTRAKTSSNGGGEPIPLDLIVEICLRLPAKSISRCRCVSKLWASIPRLPYFTELFLTRSLALPKILFACRKDSHVFFFSSPQPHQILADDNNSPVLAANYLMKIPYYYINSFESCSSVRGLMFLGDVRISEGNVSVICNLSTGQSLTLPEPKTSKRMGTRSYLGYEPIEKQYKVLSMTWEYNYGHTEACEEHQVLTLGTREPSWRMIKCCTPYLLYHEYNHVCIDGVLYYQAFSTFTSQCMVVLFDLKSEKFRFVKDTGYSHLINYNGKLGSLWSHEWNYRINGSCTSIKLRVLQDVEKHEWSEHIYQLPAFWSNTVGSSTSLRVVGVTRTNEIVFSFSYIEKPFYVFYYNTERNTIRRIEIKGLECSSVLYESMKTFGGTRLVCKTLGEAVRMK
ncbi:PREDICTED: putative F-box protein At2g19630 [Camelina sativa]|uniref:F-box protein At2g19630 n=1 Tax=Camelina sativa TaxID=90675 RepID=A0ABM0TUJ2_CAMSA|nr:PREDICTED: putative F-box protein At2g19630 [Camelina sativa]